MGQRLYSGKVMIL